MRFLYKILLIKILIKKFVINFIYYVDLNFTIQYFEGLLSNPLLKCTNRIRFYRTFVVVLWFSC